VRLLAAKVAAVLALGVAAVATVGTVTGSADVRGLARFRETQLTSDTLGTFPGATEVWSTRVYTLGSPTPIGWGDVACTVIKNFVRECSGTYVLPRGRIHVGGRLTSRSNFQLLILGGSGAYRGAGGLLTAAGAPASRVLVFSFS
jgi:hypothetical protein